MKAPSVGSDRVNAAVVFGVIPCVIGLGSGLYLRGSDVVWLTSAGNFWPVLFALAAVTSLVKRAHSPFEDRVLAVAAWLVVTWTWFDLPLWIRAIEVPRSAAVVSRDGHVTLASARARNTTDRVWLLTGLPGKRIVLNVAGSTTIHSVNVRYDFAEAYIATRRHEDDVGPPVLAALTTALANEAHKPRSSRNAVFEDRAAHSRFADKICRIAMPEAEKCPLVLHLSPQSEATAPGAVWARYHNEPEAIAEKHLPTLVRLLTEDESKVADPDRVFRLVMELADTPDVIGRVAQNARLLDDREFGELIGRVSAWPGAGDEAVGILVKVNRLSGDQRRALRAKVLSEASIGAIATHFVPLRLTDAEVEAIARRLRWSTNADPRAAVLALATFGERMPVEAQRAAVGIVSGGGAAHALEALRHINFSTEWRAILMRKILSDARPEDFEANHAGRAKLEDLLTPTELQALIAGAVAKSEYDPKWLDFVLRRLPVRDMSEAERKSLLTSLLFGSAKSALEFASENRRHLDPADVDEVTRDYARTIAPDHCLHLSHRNKNRRIDYFSDNQLQIFIACAEAGQKPAKSPVETSAIVR